jgi:hypothetical protein
LITSKDIKPVKPREKMKYNGKSQIKDNGYALSITIPAPKKYFLMIFALIWLGGWFFGFISALTSILISISNNSTIDGFIIFWLTGWTAGGVMIIFMLLWRLFGKEKLFLSPSKSTFSKTIFGIGKKIDLEFKEIKNFKFKEVSSSLFRTRSLGEFLGTEPGKIQFDYGLKTYYFAVAVDDAEANYIINKINKIKNP